MRSTVIFVTDPICSWCWGMLPEMMTVRQQLAAEMDFATRRSFERASELSAHALPTVMIDTRDGPKLVCGGYATADYLVDELRLRAARE